MKILKLHSYGNEGRVIYVNAEMIIEFHSVRFGDVIGSTIYFLDIGIRDVLETEELILNKLQAIPEKNE